MLKQRHRTRFIVLIRRQRNIAIRHIAGKQRVCLNLASVQYRIDNFIFIDCVLKRQTNLLILRKRRRRIEQQIPCNISFIRKPHGQPSPCTVLIRHSGLRRHPDLPQHIVGNLIRTEQYIDFPRFKRKSAAVRIGDNHYGKRLRSAVLSIPLLIFCKPIPLPRNTVCRLYLVRPRSRRIRCIGAIGIIPVFKQTRRKHSKRRRT